MSEVVDSIVADLILRGVDKYEAGYDRAIKKHAEFTRSIPKAGGFAAMGSIDADAQKYVDRHTKAGAAVVANETATTEKVKRTRKARTDAAVANDEVEVRSAKRAADARIAEAERVAAREARLDASARNRTIGTYGDNPGLRRAKGGIVGSTVPNEPHGQASIPASVLAGAGAADVVAEAEVNHLLADRATLQANLSVLKGREKAEVRDILDEMRLESQLRTAGIAEEEILLRLEERRALVATERTLAEKKQASANLVRGGEQFARGAGAYAALGGAPAIAGLAATVGVAAIVAATKSGLDYAHTLKVVSDQIGVTTHDLQRYEAVANTLNVTQEQLRESFSQLGNNLGKAQEGSEQQSKIFKALNIDIGNSKDGFKTLSDVLPTFLDRLSKIPNQAQRLAIETALGGEQLRRLDPVLSRGADGFDQLANSISGTSDMLSDKQIQDAAVTANKLKLLGDQLERDLSGIIANNAKSIETLATGFFRLADGALKAINAIQRFGANKVLNNPLSSDADRAQARDMLNATPEGRRQSLAKVNASLRALREAGGPGGASIGQIYIDGIGYIDNTPGGRQKARSQLIQTGHGIQAAERADTLANAPTPAQQGNPSDVSHLFSPKPPKGRKGKSAAVLESEAEQRTKRYNDELAGFQEEELRAQESLTGDIDKRAEIEKDLADRALKRQLADIESERKRNVLAGGDKDVEATRAKALSDAARAAHAAELSAIEQGKQADHARASTQAAQTVLSAQADLLSAQLALAKTAKERLAIELKLLANSEAQERNRLQGTIKAALPGSPEAKDAQAQLDTLGQRTEAQAAVARKQNQGPLANYLDTLPKTMDQVGEAIQNSAVTALQSLNSELDKAIQNMLGLHGAAGQFIADLIRIAAEHELLKLLDGKGGDGGFLSSISNAASHVFGHRAAGGNVVGGGNYLVGEHGPEIVHMGSSGQVYPNGKLANLSAGGGTTIIAPQHFDLSGVVMTRDLVVQMDARNRAYANAVGQAAAQGAVKAGPGYQARVATLGN